MKIAYLMYPEAVVVNRVNGIRNQALGWKNAIGTRARVDCLSPWDDINWSDYDVVHLFGGAAWLDWVHLLKDIHPRVVFSPILDTVSTPRKLRFLASLGIKGYHHAQNVYRRNIRCFDKIYVRSDFEAQYFTGSYGIPASKIVKIPLCYEMSQAVVEAPALPREPFALHISSLYQPRKNVERLILAAKRYGFELRLGGSTGNDVQTRQLLELIDGAPNIHLLGILDNQQAADLYRRCGVFALPSINEGVGLVALNAAACGAPVVITSFGGPKEYYIDSSGTPLAEIVDPYDIDAIGRAVVKSLAPTQSVPSSSGLPGPSPSLRSHILSNFSPDHIADLLIKSYEQ